MKIGDLVKIKEKFTAHGSYMFVGGDYIAEHIAMIIEGPNEVGKIKLLLSTGETTWKHAAEVEYLPKGKGYLKE